MERANLEDLSNKDGSWTIHENNIHALLIEIDRSLNHISPPIMQEFFNLKLLLIVFEITIYRDYLKQILHDMVRKHYVFNEIYKVSLRIQSECGEIRTRNYSVFGIFSRSVTRYSRLLLKVK